jgi:translocation and assembly module TamB
MSDPQSNLPIADPQPPLRPSRLRRFFLRHLPLTLAGIMALIVLATTSLYFVMSSERFEGLVRTRLVADLEQATGGRVDVASFHWHLLSLEADAEGIVIHGAEGPGEAPYARIDRLSARVSLLGFLSPSVLLRSLDIEHPALHLIVYRDGSTNQPHPRRPQSSGTHDLNTFFNLKAGHISVERGTVDYDSRAASFDFQNRYAPLDFQASDVSILVRYISASATTPETYRIEAGATDLDLTRHLLSRARKPQTQFVPQHQSVHGYLQATVDLTRTAIYLRSLRLTASQHNVASHTLQISGSFNDFTHPYWQAKILGDLDMRLLDPITGYPFAPEGIAHLNLDAAGQGGQFRTDGTVHVDGGAYIGTGVVATGIRLDAHVHADPERLLITSVVAAFRQGGQMEGAVDLSPWLPSVPGEATMRAASPAGTHTLARRNPAPVHPSAPVLPNTIPVNGKVTAQLKNVTLDTILDIVSQPPFQRLGIGALLNGPTTATWSNGDTRSLAVAGSLNMTPPAHLLPDEAPAYGIVDGTYTQRDGAVDLRKLELSLPGSHVQARGNMGAYPLNSASVLTVDFHSRNLGEFDTVLRSLGLRRHGKSGVEALPVALTGQADFQGTWTGSLANPHIAGNLNATQLSVEIPSSRPGQSPQPGQPESPRFVHFDSVVAAGSYSSSRIAVDHALLLRGNTRLNLKGALIAASRFVPSNRTSLTTAAGRAHTANALSFDADSVLHLKLEAAKVNAGDLKPFVEQDLPFTGVLDADLEADGPLHSLGGSGWVELNGGSLYGEPMTRMRAQGALANSVINLTSVTLTQPAGNLTATGSFDLNSHRYQVNAKGTGLDVSKFDYPRRQGWNATGKLAFTVSGSGTLADPQLDGNATLTALAFGGEPLGGLQLTAHVANHSVGYDMSTRLDTAELTMHGETALQGGYATQARLQFSHFNIDSLLKLAHVKALSGQSSLAGTITVQGPLAHMDQLGGEARLQDMEAIVAGVHLKSEGEVHATLANGYVRLDPLHITGEDTDLHLQGTLALRGTRQLDMAASGSVNLKLAETLDPDVTADGTSTFQVEAHGPLAKPNLRGRIDFQNGALALEDVPNGLSQLHGTLVFNQDRLEVQSLTAMTGGGPLTVGGYLAYQNGIYADLTVTGKGVRIRYPQGVSSLADATLHLQGPQNSLQLTGNVLITRFTVSPDLDFAALAAQANGAPSITPPDAPSNHIRLDVRIQSSPQLNFQNAFAKLAGDVDLRLRGTVATPSLLGSVSITEGSAMIAGTRYDLQRGDISFTNPVRIEPVIDLSATARVEDYDITLNLHGTPSNPSVTYRSDPPLPESDVVALLALGRTENQQRIYTQQQEQALSNPTTDALLGGALNATVSSRIQKLFGAGSVKVDPNYLGPFGNSTSRIIVEEQLGRNLTLTYATDVNTTGQQLLQAEIAINRHVSLLVARDESGVFSVVIKATRRFR